MFDAWKLESVILSPDLSGRKISAVVLTAPHAADEPQRSFSRDRGIRMTKAVLPACVQSGRAVHAT